MHRDGVCGKRPRGRERITPYRRRGEVQALSQPRRWLLQWCFSDLWMVAADGFEPPTKGF
ncbi:MAG: hypothetical protein QOH05_4584 [Acetobacteraceae bacterium]|nr:hypothetical protein [Acetobacteraceae bacterium]